MSQPELLHKIECIYSCTHCTFVTLDSSAAVHHCEHEEVQQRTAEMQLEGKEEKRPPLQPRPAPISVPLIRVGDVIVAPLPDAAENKKRVEDHLRRVREFEERKRALELEAKTPIAAPVPIVVPPPAKPPLAPTQDERLQKHLARLAQFSAAKLGAAGSTVVKPGLFQCHVQCALREPKVGEPGYSEFYKFPCPNCSGEIQVLKTEVNCGIFRHGSLLDGTQLPPHTPQDVLELLIRSNSIRGCGQPFSVQHFEGGYKVSKCGWV